MKRTFHLLPHDIVGMRPALAGDIYEGIVPPGVILRLRLIKIQGREIIGREI